MNSSLSEPKLAKPGAGLPIPQRWIARLLVPIRASQSNWSKNAERFNRHSKAIESLVRQLDEMQFNTRTLVNPIMGLEDSSRFWSAGMVLDHLIIVATGIGQIISELSHDRTPPIEVRIEKVKPPKLDHTLQLIERFSEFSKTLISSMKTGPQTKSKRLKHPWFGQLNAHQWFFVLSLHQGIHFQQLKQIVDQLKK